jgi:hypothetical protein
MTDTPPRPTPPVPPAVPPGASAGQPRRRQAALLLHAFCGLAGGSCAAFLAKPSGGIADLWSLLFVASMPFAAGAFALLVFRLWRRRAAEAWPSLVQAVLMAIAGGVLAVGGCGGWAATMDASAIWPIAMALGAVFVIGVALAVGAGELFLIGIGRLIFKRPGAR